jgi:hypothetical protein
MKRGSVYQRKNEEREHDGTNRRKGSEERNTKKGP